MRKVFLFALLLVAVATTKGQAKVYVIGTAWENSLTNYSPSAYFTRLFTVLQDRLAVNELVHEGNFFTDTLVGNKLNEWAKTRIEKRERVTNSDYFMVVSHQLTLPLINISRILFKNGVQHSRLSLYLHIYNSKGNKIASDTIISRGCIENRVSDKKGSKNFYDNHSVFHQDMLCHLEFIKQNLTLNRLSLKLDKSFFNEL